MVALEIEFGIEIGIGFVAAVVAVVVLVAAVAVVVVIDEEDLIRIAG